MKNKRAIFVLSIIVIIIAIAAVACSWIFQVKSFEIEKENNFAYLSEDSIYQVLYSYKGDSILFLDEEEMISEISLALPRANVLNIERVFPSKLVFNIEERSALFAVYQDSQYYLFDVDNYYLGTSDDRDIASSVVLLEGYGIENLNEMTEGAVAVFEGAEEKMEILNEFFSYMLTLDFEYTEFQTTYFLKEVEVSFAGDLYITTRLGVKFVIYDTDELLAEKVQYLMGAYSPDELAILTGQTIYIGSDLIPVLSGN